MEPKICAIRILFLLVLVSGFGTLQAQDVEELFQEARTLAFENEAYERAIELSLQALQAAPDYTDLRLFLGRLYFWSGQPAQARQTFEQILEQYPSHLDTRIAYLDLELENENPGSAIDLADEGLRTHPTNPDLLFRKGRALQMSGAQREAAEYFRQVQQFDPGYPFVAELIRDIGRQGLNWQVMTEYSYDRFNEIFSPWQLGSFELLRRTSAGNLLGRVNYGERFSTTDLQVVLEGYPRLGRSMYAYIGLGYADNNFFPEYQGGFSLYRSFGHGIETSLGFRYLRFNEPNLFIYTGSLSKFFLNYWVSMQAFFSPDAEGNTISGTLTLRRYFSDPDNYLSLRGGLGSAPSGFSSQQDVTRLSSYSLAAEAQVKLSPRFLLKGTAGPQQEEYQPDTNRYHWSFSMALFYRF